MGSAGLGDLANPGVQFRDMIRKEIQKQLAGVDQVVLGTVSSVELKSTDVVFEDDFTGTVIDPAKWSYIEDYEQDDQLFLEASTSDGLVYSIDLGVDNEFDAKVEFVQALGFSGLHHLRLPGSAGNYATTPDAAPLRITSDIEFQVLAAVNPSNATGDLVAKSKVGDRAYSFGFSGNGTLLLSLYEGGQIHTAESAAMVSSFRRRGYRADFRASDGRVRFFESEDDGETWVQLGGDLTLSGIAFIDSTAAPLDIGDDGGSFSGDIYSVKVISDPFGTPVEVANPYFPDWSLEQVSRSDAAGNTWTINQSGDPVARIAVEPDGGAWADSSFFVSDHGVGFPRPTVTWEMYEDASNPPMLGVRWGGDDGWFNSLRFPYDPVSQRWLRLARYAGVTFWMTSPSEDGPWAVHHVERGLQAIRVEPKLGLYGDGVSDDVDLIWDNASVSGVEVGEIEAVLDGMSVAVPVMWSAGSPAIPGDRVVCLGLRGGQQWIVTSLSADEGRFVFPHGGSHGPGGIDEIEGFDKAFADWQSYTPVLTATTTDPSLGTGTEMDGRYRVIHGGNYHTIIYQFWVEFGSGINPGSGLYRLSLPFSASSVGSMFSSDNFALGVVIGFDWSVAGSRHTFIAGLASTTTLQFWGYAGGTMAHNSPWTWADDDRFGGTVIYPTVDLTEL